MIDLKGVDIYDPTTGEVRSNDTSQIALWMIDTDYNGESFFARHCYFTGANDPSVSASFLDSTMTSTRGSPGIPFDTGSSMSGSLTSC